MAALAVNRQVDRYPDQELRSYPVKASAHIYKGAFIGRDAASGYSRPLVAGDAFEGIAYEECDNSAGANGAKSVRVQTIGDFDIALAAVITNRGATVYASDSGTATLTSSGNSAIGKLLQLADRAGLVVVRIAV